MDYAQYRGGGGGRGRGGGYDQRTMPPVMPAHVETREQRTWPLRDLTARSRADQRDDNERDLQKLFEHIPEGPMRESLAHAAAQAQADNGHVLKEVYLAKGRRCELVFATEHGGGSRVLRSNELVGAEHLAPFLPLFDGLDRAARRAGVDGTLHRISRSIHAVGAEPIAITARVGRTLQGQILPMLLPQPTAPQPSWLPRTAHHDEAAASLAVATLASRSLLLIGPPNVGKTTALRELARLLSLSDKLVVVIVDKSLEIAGTAQVPHAAIGNARVLTAESPQHQHRAMLEAVENQSPDVIIIDEISTKEECQAARTIAGRGVALVASVHGDSLAGLIGDAERSVLIGGIQAVTLSAREAAARADGRRTVQRRYGPPVFGAAIELRGFGECVVHSSVEKAVDALLDHTTCEAWWHRVKPGSPRNADEGSGVVVATPVVAVPCEGRAPAYAALSKGARVEAETDLMALSSMVPAQWVAESSITPLVYARRT